MHLMVEGVPKALKRHRSVRRGKSIGTYDPSKKDKEDFLDAVREFAPKEPITSPLECYITFYFPRPKSHYKGKELRADAPDYHTKRPDIDNLTKFVLDALNGVFWSDDSIICVLIARKAYCSKVGTFIEINRLDSN